MGINMNGNKYKLYIYTAAYNIAVNLMSGSVLQSFLLEKGISGASVSAFFAVLQAVQVLAMLGISGYIEKSQNIIKMFFWLILLQICFTFGLVVFCFDAVPKKEMFVIIYVLGVIGNIFQGICMVLSYKIPYYIMDMKDYGYLTGISGAVCGVTGTAFSFFLTVCISKYEYYNTMAVFFAIGALMLAVSSISVASYRTKQPPVVKEHTKRINIFKYKPFYLLLIPNLLRGFSYGILQMSTIIGYHCKIIRASSAGVLTMLFFLATTSGSYLYAKISPNGNNGRTIMILSLILMAIMPLMVEGGVMQFYVVFFLSQFIACVIGVAVPTAVTEFVDYSHIGEYTAWRMLLHTGGISLSGVLITPMLKTFGAFFTLVVAAAAQLVSGAVYYLYLKNKKSTLQL